MGQITTFGGASQDTVKACKIPKISNNTYIWLAGRKSYALIKSFKQDTTYSCVVSVLKKPEQKEPIKDNKDKPEEVKPSEEIEIDLSEEKEGYSATIGIDLRVVASEARKFSLTMQRSANDKIMDIATAIGEMIQVEKYGLSFYYGGKCLDL